MKEAEENISGGDPYTCAKCKAVLNKFSKVVSGKDAASSKKIEIKNNESLWECEFCGYPNAITIDKD
jgi:rubrerythrin